MAIARNLAISSRVGDVAPTLAGGHAVQQNMDGKKILTLFHNFDTVHIRKDVGAIPYYLSTTCGWDASLAFFETRSGQLEALKQTDFSRRIYLISLGRRGNRIRNAFEIMAFVLRFGKGYDVLNVYHDGVLTLLYGILYKLVNKNGVVYLKLDMDFRDLDNILKGSKKLVPRCLRRMKLVLSMRAVDFYAVETKAFYRLLAENDYFKGRLHYLPNGFTCEGDEDIHSWLMNKENIILAVGRLGHPQKFNELLVDAVAAVDRQALSGWKVCFVGPVVNESFRAYVDDACRKNPSLADIFVLPGEITDKEELHRIYKRAKIFCLTSRWESFGFVLLEAMYFGNYVISSDLPPAQELTQGGTIGSLFPVGDVRRLAELITKGLTGKIDFAVRGMESHQFAKTNYDWRIIVKELDALLDGTATRPREV